MVYLFDSGYNDNDGHYVCSDLKGYPCLQNKISKISFVRNGSLIRLTLTSQPTARHSFMLYYNRCYYDLGMRPVCGAGHRKLQPNLAPMPK